MEKIINQENVERSPELARWYQPMQNRYVSPGFSHQQSCDYPPNSPLHLERSEQSLRLAPMHIYPGNEGSPTSYTNISTQDTQEQVFQYQPFLRRQVSNEHMQFSLSEFDYSFFSPFDVNSTNYQTSYIQETSPQNNTENILQHQSGDHLSNQMNHSNLINPEDSSLSINNNASNQQMQPNLIDLANPSFSPIDVWNPTNQLSSLNQESSIQNNTENIPQHLSAKEKNKHTKGYYQQLLIVLKNEMITTRQGLKKNRLIITTDYNNACDDVINFIDNNKKDYQNRLILLILEGKENNFPGILLKSLYSKLGDNAGFILAYTQALNNRRRKPKNVPNEIAYISIAANFVYNNLIEQL